jgi:hypothetical protein
MTDQGTPTAAPKREPRDFTEMVGQILADTGISKEEIARLPRHEAAQDIKGRLWTLGDKIPLPHPAGEQTVAFLAEEGVEVRAFTVPAARPSEGAKVAPSFGIWKFRTDVAGFRFAFLPLETFMLYLGREFERQVEEMDGENLDEMEAALDFLRKQPPGTLVAAALTALEAGEHMPDEDDDGEEPEEPETPANGAGAQPAAPPAS